MNTAKKLGLPLFSQRVISLWDMREYPNEKLASAMAKLCKVKEDAVHHRENGGSDKWPPNEREKVKLWVVEASSLLEDLRLNSVRVILGKLASELPTLEIRVVIRDIDTASDLIEAELREQKFLVLHSDEVGFYNNPSLAGETFKDSWPKANRELTEAANCHAVSRYRACVFHCCLAYEGGLISLATRLKVSKQTDWGKYIVEIRNALKAKLTPKKEKHREFFARCAETFDALRVGQRNPASHFGLGEGEVIYDQAESERVLRATIDFMKNLSVRLKEPKR